MHWGVRTVDGYMGGDKEGGSVTSLAVKRDSSRRERDSCRFVHWGVQIAVHVIVCSGGGGGGGGAVESTEFRGRGRGLWHSECSGDPTTRPMPLNHVDLHWTKLSN